MTSPPPRTAPGCSGAASGSFDAGDPPARQESQRSPGFAPDNESGTPLSFPLKAGQHGPGDPAPSNADSGSGANDGPKSPVTLSATKPEHSTVSLCRRVIAHAPVILFELNAAGEVVFSAGKGLERQGLDPEDVIGRSVYDVYAGSPGFLDNIRRAMKGETLVVTNETRGGVFERWLDPIFDEGGNVTGLIGVSLDVTERRQAEADLQSSRSLLRTVLDHLPLFVWAKNAAGRFIMANAAMSEHHGLRSDEVLGRRSQDLPGMAPESVREQEALDHRVLSERRDTDASELLMHDVDSTPRWFRVRKTPLLNQAGEVDGVVGIAEDITESRHIRQELERSQALLQAIFDTFPARIAVTNTAGQTVLVNRTHAEELGLSPSEVVRRKVAYLPMPAEMALRRHQELRAVVREGRSFDYERQRPSADGPDVHERIMRVPLYEASGTVSGVLNIVLNITAQKAAEMQLRQAQKMEAIGHLAGGVAHDFNNLLQVIHGYGHVALARTANDEKTSKALEQILRAAERARDLTRKLLSVSRRQVLRPQAMDVNALAEELMRMLMPLLGECIELTLELAPTLPAIHADAGMVEQVLMNLCVNARDAMPQGGVLTLRTDSVTLDEHERQRHGVPAVGRYVRLTVMDSGTGIPKDVLPRIFEPFFTTKAEGRGTGLGLCTAYGIVRQHGGSIRVESTCAGGTTFSVLLPAKGGAADGNSPPGNTPIPRGDETVLVVDDEESVLGLLVDLLQSQGYRVLTAKNGLAAKEVFSERGKEIDLVVLDLSLPKANGIDVIRHIRAHTQDVGILLSTAYVAEAMDTPEIRDGTVRVIEKPYSPYELFRAVRTVLDAARTGASP